MLLQEYRISEQHLHKIIKIKLRSIHTTYRPASLKRAVTCIMHMTIRERGQPTSLFALKDRGHALVQLQNGKVHRLHLDIPSAQETSGASVPCRDLLHSCICSDRTNASRRDDPYHEVSRVEDLFCVQQQYIQNIIIVNML